MWYREKTLKRKRANAKALVPKYRLWLSYVGTALVITRVIVFLVQTKNALCTLECHASYQRGHRGYRQSDRHHGQYHVCGALLPNQRGSDRCIREFYEANLGVIGPFW
jgi:hypothetical protein